MKRFLTDLQLPPFAIPLAVTFLLGWALVLLFPEGALLGLSHHLWTGILFFGTLGLMVYLLVAGIHKEQEQARKDQEKK